VTKKEPRENSAGVCILLLYFQRKLIKIVIIIIIITHRVLQCVYRQCTRDWRKSRV